MRSSTDDSTADNHTRDSGRAAETLPILPLPDGVVLPEMVVTVSIESDEARHAIEAATSDRLLLVPRVEGRFSPIGVIATIEDRGVLPNGSPALTVRSHQRARISTGVVGTGPATWVEAEPVGEHPAGDADVDALTAEYRATARSLLHKVGGRRLASALGDIAEPGALADSIGYWPELSLERRLQLLETVAIDARLTLATAWAKEALAEIETRDRIQHEVTDGLEKTQREAILRRQLAAIQAELDGDDGDAIAAYRAQLADAQLPDATAEVVTKEIDRLERTGTDSMEASWIRTWLDTVFELPWNQRHEERLDLTAAREILDADHTGLSEVKDRLIEFLAVRKLRADRGITNEEIDTRRSGVILALVGPPGVGKTSLGASIARSLNRPFVRLALGGVRDEAEIRGHRRTYVGARPGRLVRAMTEAGSMNPVILLDEIDKLTGGYQGDPAAALLEVLDPAQNQTFRDHYLEFELDLSDVVFIATGNVLDTIPGPLLDRMEVVTLEGYTESEKATIARDHLLPKLLRSNGLHDSDVTIPEATIDAVVGGYTREAGVRRLERQLDKLLRKTATTIATKASTESVTIEPADIADLLGRPIPRDDVAGRIDRPGIATGLAVTGTGGDVLFVETSLAPGDGEPVLTGQLGDVMKESASIARSVLVGLADSFGFDLPAKRLHVHFPAGAVPKDGPSAGITMTTALVSLLTNRRVRSDVAMTGEITLGGRVLPIGGVKQKLLAAHRAGITTVLLPAANGPDLEDVPDDVLERLEVHLVGDIAEVLGFALGRDPVGATA